MKKVLLPLLAACCLFPVAAFAGHPLITDSAQTVEPIKHEAETAVEYGKKSNLKETLIQETMTVGILKNVDTFVAAPLKFISGDESVSGMSDVSLGAKWNFKTIDKTALAIKPFLVLPVGGLGEGGVGFGAIAVATQELDSHLSVDGNLTYKHQSTRGDSYNEFDASLAGRYEVSKLMKAVGELAMNTTDVTDSKAKIVLGFGAIYEAQKHLDVDLGVRFGLTSEAEDFRLLAGVTCKF